MSHLVSNLFSSLEWNPGYRAYEFWKNPEFKKLTPVLVSTPNRVRDGIASWLKSEGFQGDTPHIDLTMTSKQKAPTEQQMEWVEVKDPGHWAGKEWSETWKAMVEGFEERKRSELDKYFALLITPVPQWTQESEENAERHVLFENRNVHAIFTGERGWAGRIVIWMAQAAFSKDIMKPDREAGQWKRTPNEAQYKGADWKNLISKVNVEDVEEAKRIAWQDERIRFFFYVHQPMHLEGKDGPDGWEEKGVFMPGDAVFFSEGKWAGSAPQCDLYEKL